MSVRDSSRIDYLVVSLQNANIALSNVLDEPFEHDLARKRALALVDKYTGYMRALVYEQAYHFYVESPSFNLTVIRLTGGQSVLTVDGNTLVLDLCRKLETETGTAPIGQKLIYKGMRLEYDKTLGDYAIDGTEPVSFQFDI